MSSDDATFFNANSLSPQRVAELYVDSPHFEAITSEENVLLVGPRGSGKTTLMKMQTREAMDAWQSPVAAKLLRRETLGIYIGSDEVLRAQQDLPEEGARLPKDREALGKVRRVRLSLQVVDTVFRAIDHELRAERARFSSDGAPLLAEGLRELYRITTPYSSWSSCRLAVEGALSTLSSALQDASQGWFGQVHELSSSYIAPSLADTLVYTQRLAQRVFSGVPRKWMLLFDELENLSERGRAEVVGLIRTLGDSFSVKISLTPLSFTEDFVSRVQHSFMHQGHDFSAVSLAFNSTSEMRSFSDRLAQHVIIRTLGESDNIPLQSIFGVSLFADARRVTGDSPRVAARPPDDELIRELSASQPRFARYAERTGLNRGVEGLDENARAAYFRKALPIMLLWLERQRPDADLGDDEDRPQLSTDVGGRRRTRLLRGRKSYAPYCGYPHFLLAADGNPRALLRMMNQAVQNLDRTGDGQVKRVAVEAQSDALESARLYQVALANSYLSIHRQVWGTSFTIDVIHEIGSAFEYGVHLAPQFPNDPATSFRIDNDIPAELARALTDAYYTGIIVSLDPVRREPSDVLHPSIPPYGQRFRLSYLQGCVYWLPMRKGRMRSLSGILQEAGRRRPEGQERFQL